MAELGTDGRANARRRDGTACRPVARTVLRQSVRAEDLKAQRRAIIAANDLRTLGEPGAGARHDRILRARRSRDGTRVVHVIEPPATAGARLLRLPRRAARRPRTA